MSQPRVIDRRAVRRFVAAGMAKAAVARQLGISQSSIFRILRTEPRRQRVARARLRPVLSRADLEDRIVAARLGWPGLWSAEAVCLLALEQHPIPWLTADEVAIGVEGLLDVLDLPGRSDRVAVERVLASLVAQGYVVRAGGVRTRAKFLLSDRARGELRRRAAQGRIRAGTLPVVRCHAHGQ